MNHYAIYPKQFKDIKQRIDANTCFIIMPFKDKNVYETIKRAISACNLNFDRSDQSTISAPFINKIITSITRAYYLIVDISGQNANVLYELGIAHTLRDADRVLILKDTETICPSDLEHITYFEYSKNNLVELYDHIVTFLKTNHYINDLKELMILLNIISDDSDSDYSLKIIQEKLSCKCLDLINILNNSFNLINENDVNSLLIELYKLINVELTNKDLCNIFLKLICISLRKIPLTYDMEIFSSYVFGNSVVDVEDQEMLNINTEIAVELLKFEKYNKALYDWIKLFLSESSPASICIARYKLNIGFINSKSNESTNFLLNNLRSENNTLIEHAINLCHAKKIKESTEYALKILDTTDNPFVFRSAIDLITDVGNINQFEEMFNIFKKKEKFINKHDFIKIHIQRAELKKSN